MVEHFLHYLSLEKQYSNHTVHSYRNDLQQFCEYLRIAPSEFDPVKVKESDIRMWIVSLLEQKISPRTVNRKLSSLKSFWKFCIKIGRVDENILHKIVSLKVPETLPTFYKKSEMDELFAYDYDPDNFEEVRDSLVLQMFYETGMRRAELIGLQMSNVSLADMTLKVLGKRNKERIIPFGQSLKDLIVAYLALRSKCVTAQTGFLFLLKNGKPLYPKAVHNIVVNRISQIENISTAKKSPHVLRHTFATAMMNNGADINVIKELLGHANLAATQIYTHAVFDEIYNTYKHAHPRA